MKKYVLGTILFLLLITPAFADEVTDMYEEGSTEQETTDTTTVDETEDTITATEEETTATNTSENFYTVELIRGSQSGFDKYVPIIVRITPNETPTRTQITWETPDDFKTQIKHSEFIDGLQKGTTYEYEIRVKPENAGSYEIFVNVTAWEPESNYTTSSSIIVTFNKSLVVDGSDSVYIIGVISKTLLILLAIAGLGFGIYKGWKKLFVFLKDYLKPPEL